MYIDEQPKCMRRKARSSFVMNPVYKINSKTLIQYIQFKSFYLGQKKLLDNFVMCSVTTTSMTTMIQNTWITKLMVLLRGYAKTVAEQGAWEFVVWTSLGPLPQWVPGPTTRWAPGTTWLALHGTWWHEAQGLRRRSTRLGSCTCPALYGRLLDILD
jgi:hypothetical protein